MEKGWAINGQPFDPSRIDVHPLPLNGTELWYFHSDRSYPLHLHLAHCQISAHGGRPRASDAGWKDTISMYAGQASSVLVKFNGYRGRYVFHCHNLEHEDMAMMGECESDMTTIVGTSTASTAIFTRRSWSYLAAARLFGKQ
jgi:spore coat protein A